MDTSLDIERYRVKHHQKIKLSRFSTSCDQEGMNKLEVKKKIRGPTVSGNKVKQ